MVDHRSIRKSLNRIHDRGIQISISRIVGRELSGGSSVIRINCLGNRGHVRRGNIAFGIHGIQDLLCICPTVSILLVRRHAFFRIRHRAAGAVRAGCRRTVVIRGHFDGHIGNRRLLGFFLRDVRIDIGSHRLHHIRLDRHKLKKLDHVVLAGTDLRTDIFRILVDVALCNRFNLCLLVIRQGNAVIRCVLSAENQVFDLRKD